MSEISTNIRTVRRTLDLSQTEFAFKIGLTMRGIQRWESDEVKIRETSIDLICTTFNVNHEWLLTGKGEMFNRDTKTFAHIKTEKSLANINERTVRYYPDLKVSAGGGAFVDKERVEDFIVDEKLNINPDTDIIISVMGDSMNPTLYNKDKLIVSIDEEMLKLSPENIYVVRTDDTIIIKRYMGREHSVATFSSDNKLFSDYKLDLADEHNKIIARVIGLIYREIRYN